MFRERYDFAPIKDRCFEVVSHFRNAYFKPERVPWLDGKLLKRCKSRALFGGRCIGAFEAVLQHAKHNGLTQEQGSCKQP